MKHSFFDDVYAVVRLIPEGKATSYGAIAKYLGMKGSSRMVGWALNSPPDLNIPTHRVVNRNGLLTGKHHFGGQDEMKMLLEKEGVKIEEDIIIDFDKVFWDPSVELI